MNYLMNWNLLSVKFFFSSSFFLEEEIKRERTITSSYKRWQIVIHQLYVKQYILKFTKKKGLIKIFKN